MPYFAVHLGRQVELRSGRAAPTVRPDFAFLPKSKIRLVKFHLTGGRSWGKTDVGRLTAYLHRVRGLKPGEVMKLNTEEASYFPVFKKILTQ